MPSPPPLLQLRGISKRFPGVQALDEVDLTLSEGEILALMGENGAGKSTLIKVLTGVYQRDEGMMELEGQNIDPRNPTQAQACGISTVYQEVNLIPHLSVAENISLGRQSKRFGFLNWGEIRRRGEAALARLGLSIDVNRSVASCSIAIQQLVAIARALDVSAKVLILDEPTSSLDAQEVEQLFGILRKLRGEGLGIIFVTHFLDQVYAIADRITVLRNGKKVGDFNTAELPKLQLVAKMMGKALEEVAALAPATAQTPQGEPWLAVSGLAKKGLLRGVDLQIRKGEVVGLAGLLGSGRTETARLLFGIERPDQGEVRINGKQVSIRSPRQAIKHGLGFCPEDRKTEGLIPNLSLRENIILALQGKRGWFRALSWAEQQRLADEFIQKLRIATPDSERAIKFLSGGNQQKGILARWMAAEPNLLILDEPTRGIDVGAKVEIEKLMRTLAESGLALLFISSELEEVVRSSRKVVVLRDRKKVGELTGSEISETQVMRMIAEGQAEGLG